MKAIDGLIRLHRWRLDEKRLKLSELERLVGTLREEIRKLGELVTAEALDYLTELRAAGGELRGLKDPTMRRFRILDC